MSALFILAGFGILWSMFYIVEGNSLKWWAPPFMLTSVIFMVICFGIGVGLLVESCKEHAKDDKEKESK